MEWLLGMLFYAYGVMDDDVCGGFSLVLFEPKTEL